MGTSLRQAASFMGITDEDEIDDLREYMFEDAGDLPGDDEDSIPCCECGEYHNGPNAWCDKCDWASAELDEESE